MRGSPESVAADSFVPGNIPDAADDAASDGDDVAPDVPGDRKSFRGDAGGGAGLEGCGEWECAGHLRSEEICDLICAPQNRATTSLHWKGITKKILAEHSQDSSRKKRVMEGIGLCHRRCASVEAGDAPESEAAGQQKNQHGCCERG